MLELNHALMQAQRAKGETWEWYTASVGLISIHVHNRKGGDVWAFKIHPLRIESLPVYASPEVAYEEALDRAWRALETAQAKILTAQVAQRSRSD